MAKLLLYDVATLIELVEERPCLWDKTSDYYRNKIEKQKAWREIYRVLVYNFDELDVFDQETTGKRISRKWENIRDSFIKSVRKTSGQSSSKKYIYHDSLEFLLRPSVTDTNDDSIDMQLEEDESECSPDEHGVAKIKLERIKRPRLQESVNGELSTVSRSTQTPDEDEAFFMTIIPSVKRMTEEHKLEFRLRVLQIIRGLQRGDSNLPGTSCLY